MNDKIRKATERFLALRGYELVEWMFDDTCVFIDDDTIVICEVYTDKCTCTRKLFEQYIVRFFSDIEKNAKYDCMGIRFDTIFFNVLDNSHAVIRHHIKADDEFDSDERWCE